MSQRSSICSLLGGFRGRAVDVVIGDANTPFARARDEPSSNRWRRANMPRFVLGYGALPHTKRVGQGGLREPKAGADVGDRVHAEILVGLLE